MNRKNQRTKNRKISGVLNDRLESVNSEAIENGMPADQALAINAYHLMALMQFVTGGEAPIGTAFALDVMAGYLKDRYQPDSLKIDDDIAEITIDSNQEFIEVSINDDGPGFPDDVIDRLGEPYIKSKSRQVESNSGTGLGTFLGKTLLERQMANLSFSNKSSLGGATVSINWKVEKKKTIV